MFVPGWGADGFAGHCQVGGRFCTDPRCNSSAAGTSVYGEECGVGNGEAEGRGNSQILSHLYGVCMELVWNNTLATRNQHPVNALAIDGHDARRRRLGWWDHQRNWLGPLLEGQSSSALGAQGITGAEEGLSAESRGVSGCRRPARRGAFRIVARFGQELAKDVCRGIGVVARGQELRDVSQVVAGRDQRQLVFGFGPNLADADRGGKPVANAFASMGVRFGAAFGQEVGHRFGGTAVADSAVALAVGMAEVAEVAKPWTLFVERGIGEGLIELRHFEWKSGR